MSETQQTPALPKTSGMTAGIVGCVLGGLGIPFFGIIFIPLGTIAAIIGTILSIKQKHTSGIWVNVLAWVLLVIAFFASPTLVLMLGLGTYGLAS